MKRRPLKRRSGLAPIGKQAAQEAPAELAFNRAVRERCVVPGLTTPEGDPLYRCERCAIVRSWITPHRLCLRSRSRGHRWKHDPDRNGAGLCSRCHAQVHFGTRSQTSDHDDWIKPRAWLDAGGRLS